MVLIAVAGLAGCASGGAAVGLSDSRIEKAYDSCKDSAAEASAYEGTFEVGDGGDSLIANGVMADQIGDLACLLLEFDTPQSVVAAMDSTTAMMGRQHEESDGLTYEWSYHPDNGMDLVVTD